MTKPMLYPEIRRPVMEAGLRDPLLAYSIHKKGAANRGVPFTLSFEQWWGYWEPHWAERGNKAMQKCMCRAGDKGGYEVGNVRIATNKENHHEKILEWRVAHAHRPYRSGEGRKILNKELVSWARNENPFQAYQEESEAA